MKSDAKLEIKEYAKGLGIAAFGVTGPERLDIAKPMYQERIDRGYLTGGTVSKRGFEPRNLERRFDPGRSLNDVRSIISVAVPYNVDYPQDNKPQYHGQVARLAWGRDYHAVLIEKMTQLLEFIRSLFPGLRYRMMADTGPLLDRIVAWRAGLGWVGKNNMLIVPHVGSFVFLGEILINKSLEPDPSLSRDCGGCKECLMACPTKALVEPYTMDARICISYLTQTADPTPDWIIPKLDSHIYGCDVCQSACPHNITAPRIGDKAFMPETLKPYPDLPELISMDQQQYVRTIGQTSARWIGRDILQRSAIVALANYRDAETLRYIEKLEGDERPLIRDTARWARSFIRGKSVRPC